MQKTYVRVTARILVTPAGNPNIFSILNKMKATMKSPGAKIDVVYMSGFEIENEET